MRLKLNPRYSVTAGLLLVVLGLVFHHDAPGVLGGDAVASFLMGVGLALELIGVMQLGRSRGS